MLHCSQLFLPRTEQCELTFLPTLLLFKELAVGALDNLLSPCPFLNGSNPCAFWSLLVTPVSQAYLQASYQSFV